MSQLRIKGAVALWRDLLGTIGYFVIGLAEQNFTPTNQLLRGKALY